MDFERYYTYIEDFFDNYPEVQSYINKLDLDSVYDLIIKEVNRLGDDAFHTLQIRLTSCLSYILIKANINPIEHVTKIPAYFMYEHDIENLDISNVKFIDENAFANCNNLKHIKISNVDTIFSKAFASCVKLQSVDIQNVTNIGHYVFDNCYRLEIANIDDNTKHIGIGAFYDCEKLLNFKWPKNAIEVDTDTFTHCESLQTLEIPNTICQIFDEAFLGCGNLKSIEFNGSKEEWEKVLKARFWRKKSAISEIKCTDGVVKYSVG